MVVQLWKLGHGIYRGIYHLVRNLPTLQISLQLDKSTNVSDDAQLMVYVRYRGPNDMDEDFLFFPVVANHHEERRYFHDGGFVHQGKMVDVKSVL